MVLRHAGGNDAARLPRGGGRAVTFSMRGALNQRRVRDSVAVPSVGRRVELSCDSGVAGVTVVLPDDFEPEELLGSLVPVVTVFPAFTVVSVVMMAVSVCTLSMSVVSIAVVSAGGVIGVESTVVVESVVAGSSLPPPHEAMPSASRHPTMIRDRDFIRSFPLTVYVSLAA